jgi:hypothetical protein
VIRAVLLLCAALSACRPKDEPTPADPTPTPSTPTPAPTPTDPVEPLALTELGSRLHEQFPTLVYARWTQSEAASVRVEYAVDPGLWRSSPSRARAEGPQEELLLGLPYDSEVAWRVIAEDGTTSPDQQALTGPAPADLPRATVTAFDEDRADPDTPYVLSSITALDTPDSQPWWAVIVDRQGRAVWASRSPEGRVTKHARLSADGRAMLLDLNGYWFDFDASDSQVIKVLLDGTVLHTYDTPGLHHPFLELPSGSSWRQSLVYGAYVGWYTEQLRVVEEDGSNSLLWDCDPWLAAVDADDYCASNTITYHEPTDTLLFSLFSVETIVELDAATGEALRWFGHVDGSYAFDPPGSAFWWQHGGIITPTGTLLTSSDLDPDGTETIVREYEIDEEAQALREVWSFGIGDGIYGRVRGEALRLGNGNTLHNTGEAPRLREATPSGEVVWDLEWEDGEIGRSAPIADLYSLAP